MQQSKGVTILLFHTQLLHHLNHLFNLHACLFILYLSCHSKPTIPFLPTSSPQCVPALYQSPDSPPACTVAYFISPRVYAYLLWYLLQSIAS